MHESFFFCTNCKSISCKRSTCSCSNIWVISKCLYGEKNIEKISSNWFCNTALTTKYAIRWMEVRSLAYPVSVFAAIFFNLHGHILLTLDASNQVNFLFAHHGFRNGGTKSIWLVPKVILVKVCPKDSSLRKEDCKWFFKIFRI